jgi:signal transduction histidine kinase
MNRLPPSINGKIHIVDDSPTIVRQLVKILEEVGLTCVSSSDGEKGYEVLRQDTTFDLIILDQHMPKLTGIELCHKIRNELNRGLIPILFITGTTDREEIANIFRAGANDYIAKPFAAEEIVARVSTHLATYRLILENQRVLEQLKEAHHEVIEGARILEHRVTERTEELRIINKQLQDEIEVRKEKERELEQSIVVAQTALRVKSEFLANMSHEIRTPLNGILGMTDQVLDTQITEEQRELLSTVSVSGVALLNIVNDILDFSKIEAGKLSIANEPFNLHSLIKRVCSIVKPRSDEKEQSFIVDITPHVPQMVRGDEVRLGQILMNLLANAIKFTPQEGGVVFRIYTKRITPACVDIAFAITDSGIGISSEKIDAIFEAFQQEDSSTTRKFGGTGLGLSISRKLAELMSGELDVQSTQGVGSIFTLTLPCPTVQKELSVIEEVSTTIVVNTASSEITYRPRNIILAEDNAVNQALALRILRKRGHEVMLAVNGLEVLKILEKSHGERRFDLILMDCQMPELSGYEAAQEIRKHSDDAIRKIPIIALTAHALQGDRERCIDSGMNDYLTKPLDKILLMETIDRWAREGSKATE